MKKIRQEEIIRIADGAKVAVLCIHGIVGTPHHFDKFTERIPENISYYNMLLEGHGGDVRNFSKASMKIWESQVSSTVDALLQKHEKIIILAHSMGTLFAMNESIKHPDRISELFLLDTPLKVFFRPRMLKNIYKILLGKIDPTNTYEVAVMNSYSLDVDLKLWRYIGWIPRYLELFRKIRQTRKIIHEIPIPTHVYQSARDELVANSAIKYIRNNEKISLQILENSTHFYYPDEEMALMLLDFDKIINK